MLKTPRAGDSGPDSRILECPKSRRTEEARRRSIGSGRGVASATYRTMQASQNSTIARTYLRVIREAHIGNVLGLAVPDLGH